MREVSEEAYNLLVDAYERRMEEFLEDPVGSSWGNSIKGTYDELKRIGTELGCDIDISDFELNKINELIGIHDQRTPEYYENDISNGKEDRGTLDWLFEGDESYTSIEDHTDKKPQEITPSDTTKVCAGISRGKNVESTLKELSESRKSVKPDELIGEWATYDTPED